ncbi:N-alpha-acetyltransferase 35, NatC auxiliary subunit-like [Zophobas morio]|uniref:N-alpha-acetyltransferase 35, NatC auxiliary subunit-like n=1 Tax=Zophobas morio TaxID=2755281 RepID=UPI0030834690
MEEFSEWEDITVEFMEKARCLEIGEVVSCISFYDAMTALEMMEPKMDMGLHLISNPDRILSIEDALNRNLVKIKEFAPKEVIGIFDELLRREVSWLSGQSIAQTIYSSLYMLRPSIVEDPILLSLCLGLSKTSTLMHKILLDSGVCSEEDFQFKLLNSDSHDYLPDDREVVNLLEDSIAFVTSHLKANKLETEELLSWRAVQHRLKFRLSLLQFFMQWTTCSVHNSSASL